MKIYDTHLHTHHSHDGRFSCSEIAYEAVKRKLSGICITDHYDSALCKGNKDFLHIKKALKKQDYVQKILKESLKSMPELNLVIIFLERSRHRNFKIIWNLTLYFVQCMPV